MILLCHAVKVPGDITYASSRASKMESKRVFEETDAGNWGDRA
jgi:hypothetical protein